MKHSDFTGNKYYIFYVQIKLRFLKFLVPAFIDVITMPNKFQRNRWSRSPYLEIPSKIQF